MPIDLSTLVLALGITHFVQVLVFSHQFRTIKTYAGIGYWLLWSVAETAGFFFMLLRRVPVWEIPAIAIHNALIVAGVVFLYLGIVRFFECKGHTRLILALYALFVLFTLYFLIIHDHIVARGVVIFSTLAAIAFLTAYVLFVLRPPNLKNTANFIGVFFLIHGLVMLVKVGALFMIPEVAHPLYRHPINIVMYIDALVCSILWTYVLIVMINQRLYEDIKLAKEKFELVFNTSPDAAIISRLDDGMITSVNDGFETLFGYRRADAVGKRGFDLALWANPEDRGILAKKLIREGKLQNVDIALRNKDGGPIAGLLSATLLAIHGVPHVLSMVREISEIKDLQEKLRDLSLRDDLTGLYNRRGFFTLVGQQLKLAERSKDRLLMFFIDLDGMKRINDVFGHQEGDRALTDLATLLKETFRDTDIIARLGGDEFAVFAVDTKEGAPDNLLNRLNKRVAAFNAQGARKYDLSLSVGFSICTPEQPCTLDDMIAEADRTMYEDKEAKKRGQPKGIMT
ncbi:MAG: sensor domain-containing diguanylate cyclase [Syntrophales bacterium]|nr:sensor domain-containing diguanylate cyclase [Syntrophales bacterium]